jgi:hypothetical protein
MNIYQKLVEVRKAVPYLQKEAKGHQYNYVSSSQVLAAVRKKMDEVGLLLIPSVVDKEVHIDGKNIFTELKMEFTWVNAEKPDETIKTPWYGQGMDIAGEKGVGKALTYAEKYFLLKFFNIATDKDDPDAFQHKDEQKPEKPQLKRFDGMATKSQRDSINTAIKALGITTEQLQVLLDSLGIESSKTMTYDQANQLIEALADYKPAKEAAH